MLQLKDLQLECGHASDFTTVEVMDDGAMLYDGWVTAERQLCDRWTPRTFENHQLAKRVIDIYQHKNCRLE